MTADVIADPEHKNGVMGINRAGDAVTVLIGNRFHDSRESGISFADRSEQRSALREPPACKFLEIDHAVVVCINQLEPDSRRLFVHV